MVNLAWLALLTIAALNCFIDKLLMSVLALVRRVSSLNSVVTSDCAGVKQYLIIAEVAEPLPSVTSTPCAFRASIRSTTTLLSGMKCSARFSRTVATTVEGNACL